MRSEHQHIDDFFRKKEEEYQHDSGDPGAGWEQMKALLTPGLPPAPKGFRMLSTRRIVKYLGGFTVVTVMTLVAITTLPSKKKMATGKTLAAKSTTTSGSRQQLATTQPADTQMPRPRLLEKKKEIPTTVRKAVKPTLPASSGNGHPRPTQSAPVKRAITPKPSEKPLPRPSQPADRAQHNTSKPINSTTTHHKTTDNTGLHNALAIADPGRITQPSTGQNSYVAGSEKPVDAQNNSPVVKLNLGTGSGPTASSGTELTEVIKLTPAQAREKLNQFYKQIDKPAQRYNYHVSQEATITGQQGTRLIIPANAFANRKGEIRNEIVTIVLKEYYSYDDMIAAKLSTTAGDQQLISGGMVYVEAQVNGEKVNIAPGKQINLQMPTPTVDPDMQLFKGTRSSIKNAFQAKFMDNRMIDTIRFLKKEADENGEIDWVAMGQRPGFDDLLNRQIRVFNPFGDPYLVRHSNKIKAWFYVSKNCKYSDQEMKEKIRAHSNYYYDKIKIRRVLVAPVANYNSREDVASIAGDSVYMTFRQALRKKLLTTEDSLQVLTQLRQEDERQNQRRELMNKYSFPITGLGWYNCDKFNNVEGPKILFTFKAGEGFEPGTMVSHLVFTRYKSILRGAYDGNKIEFGRVPKDEPVKVVCIGIKNGKVMACVQELNTGREAIGQLAFRETSPDQFRQNLQDLAKVLP
ncbi:hypothetical protein [Paraflavitalea sp. CAU 1676]|uniref:hypothetical protein n=1 Tax=Paraflavitalea sp. CAU 1676 TaxID=3032598 RepID=UPI0023DC585B|nr:hypothetical protein [Paraflavitalea sp. CAU 1676]MDF2187652.1 hypothetical protein [Paraflavitalea sp. CAU 1676]